ncbi:MAG TPA: MBL fold metallo-hydrolase, partial [Taishania sp.]|nr:MBL fold metallo-hydrolase [Taishania sp.]
HQLKFVQRIGDFTQNAIPNMDVLFVDGHTESMMIPHIQYKEKTVVFMADLLPSVGHIPLPYVMGYDTRPLLTLSEKEKFLIEAAQKGYYLFLEHDSVNELCTVKETEKGIRLDQTFSFAEIFGN